MNDTPWQVTLASTFNQAADALNQQAQNAPDAATQQAVLDKQGQLRLAAEQLTGGAVDAVIASAAGLTATLTQAAADAKTAATVIADIAAAANFLGSLLALATAIVGAAANPGGLLTAAQGVINAAKPFLPAG